MTAFTEIGIVIFPRMTQLDITAPFEVFARLPNTRVHLLWKTLEPITSDVGLTIQPTMTFADCPKLDVLCIGGGPGQVPLMADEELMGFLRHRGKDAGYVTSVCAGCLFLGGAGLLAGYRSACHWLMRDQLEQFGAIASEERIVVDRNRISGGGVTAGMDFGLQLAAILKGDRVAKELQLFLEYAPLPPFDSGSEHTAEPEVVAAVRARAAPMLEARWASTRGAVERMRQLAG
jgi:cyclohexyl-isocyanide hydratase